MWKLHLLIPLVLVSLVLLTIVLLLCHYWWCAFAVFIVLYVLNIWSESFPFHLHNKNEGDFSVLSFNVNRAHDFSENNGTPIELANAIISESADIVLLQEYNVNLYPDVAKVLKSIYLYDLSVNYEGRFKTVFSKYPIISFCQLTADNPDEEERTLPISAMDFSVKGRMVRVLNCHLMSNNYSVAVRQWKKEKNSLFWCLKNII